MNYEQHSGNPDGLWQQFSLAETLAAEELAQAYQLVEGYNAQILNKVAGIADSGLTFEEALSDKALQAPDLSAPIGNDSLYLKPDTRAWLQEQGEQPDIVERDGTPLVIFGEVPQETKAMLAHMLSATNAEHDAANSTPNVTIWHGDVAGQPVRFEMYRKTKIGYEPDGSETRMPVTSMQVFREDS